MNVNLDVKVVIKQLTLGLKSFSGREIPNFPKHFRNKKMLQQNISFFSSSFISGPSMVRRLFIQSSYPHSILIRTYLSGC